MSLSSTSPVSAAMLAWILLISVGVVSGVAPGARNASLMCNLNASAAVDYLTGKHLRVGLYSGELSNIDDNGIWTGYDIDLLDKLAGLGGFTYSTVHVGKAAEIEAGEMSYTNRAKWLLGVTNTISDERGREIFDVLPGYEFGAIDIMGQGTWRVNAERINWAVFANAVVSEEARFVTRAAATSGMTYDERVLFLFKPFTVEVWLILLAAVVAHALVSWMIERDSHKKNVVKKKAEMWRAEKRLTARDAELKRHNSATAENLKTNQPTAANSGPIRMGSTYVDNVEHTATDHHDAKKELKNLGFETFYHACISCGGEHHYDPESTELRVVNVGWVFFVFLIGSIYSANLTAILTLGPEEVEPYSGLDRGDTSCIKQDCTFCVKDGAANQKFFTETYGPPENSLNINAVESITAQIENLANNKGCDAIELTAEDFWKWGKNMPSSTRCKVEVQGAIVKRPRGMMAPVENACIITGINSLYHKFTTQKSLIAGGNADDLHGKHFPVQGCPETDERANLKISIDQLAGAFGLVAFVLLYGIIHHFCGKAIRRNFRKVTGNTKKEQEQSPVYIRDDELGADELW